MLSHIELALCIIDAGEVEVDLLEGFTFKTHEFLAKRGISLRSSPVKFRLTSPNHPTRPGNVKGCLLEHIASALIEMMESRGIRPNAVAGIPHAGSAIAAEVGGRIGLPVLQFRKTSMGIGSLENPEDCRDGKLVLLLDNAITLGISAKSALMQLKKEGLEPAGLLTVVNWGLGGSESISVQYPLPLLGVHSIYQAIEFIAIGAAHREQLFSPAVCMGIEEFLEEARHLLKQPVKNDQWGETK